MNTQRPTPKAVLWDLDGTILDSISGLLNGLNKIFPEFGLPLLTRESIHRQLHGSFDDVIRRLTHNHPQQNEILERILDPRFRQDDTTTIHEGMSDVVDHFSKLGLQQALVTSRGNYGENDTYGATNMIRSFQLHLHIKTIVAAEDVTHHKPHPEPILLALEKLGIEPHHAVMIGDQSVDAQAAQAAGVASILIDHEQTTENRQALQAAHPDRLCSNAVELTEAVKDLLHI